MKELEIAKCRLAEVLTLEERRELVLAMLGDVLAASGAVESADVSVLSPDADVLAFADRCGARSLPDHPRAPTLDEALEQALPAVGGATEAVLVLLADTPLVSAQELRTLITAGAPGVPSGGGGRRVVLAPDRAERGTNALLRCPPTIIPTRFGPESLTRHLAEARARGIPAQVCRLPGLALDLDTPADLRAFLARPGDTGTHRLLDRLNLDKRLQVMRDTRSG